MESLKKSRIRYNDLHLLSFAFFLLIFKQREQSNSLRANNSSKYSPISALNLKDPGPITSLLQSYKASTTYTTKYLILSPPLHASYMRLLSYDKQNLYRVIPQKFKNFTHVLIIHCSSNQGMSVSLNEKYSDLVEFILFSLEM